MQEGTVRACISPSTLFVLSGSGVSCHCPGTWLVLQIKKRARGAEFDFNSPEWAAISDGAKDLLRKLIVRNPAVCVLSCLSLGHGPGSASLCTVPVLLRSLCYT
jgi:hypothetical protein